MLKDRLAMRLKAFLQRKAFVMRPNCNDQSLRELVCRGLTHDNNIGIEIGCYAGESTLQFLATGKFQKLYCIDPWMTGYDKNDIASYTNKYAERDFDRRTASRPEVVKIKDFSYQVAQMFDDHSIDFIYIDGEHTYEGVRNDLDLYSRKVKADGVIAGHDYVDGWGGVVKAVNEFFQVPPHETFKDGSWLYFNERM